MEEQTEEIFQENKPGFISWLIAVTCTAIVLSSITFADKFITGVHSAVIRDRILSLIETNIRPDIILEDEFIKKKPEQHLIKIQKSVALYNSIYGEDYDRAKLMVDEPVKKPSKSITELRRIIGDLVQIQKDLRIPTKAVKVPTEDIRKKMREDALTLSKDIIKRESLPKVGAISELAYNTAKKKNWLTR